MEFLLVILIQALHSNVQKYKVRQTGKHFDLTTDSLIEKRNYFNKFWNFYFSNYPQNATLTIKLKPNQKLFDRTYSNLTSFAYQKILKYFDEFLSFTRLSFLSFTTKINRNSGNETRSDIFPPDIFKSGTVSY